MGNTKGPDGPKGRIVQLMDYNEFIFLTDPSDKVLATAKDTHDMIAYMLAASAVDRYAAQLEANGHEGKDDLPEPPLSALTSPRNDFFSAAKGRVDNIAFQAEALPAPNSTEMAVFSGETGLQTTGSNPSVPDTYLADEINPLVTEMRENSLEAAKHTYGMLQAVAPLLQKRTALLHSICEKFPHGQVAPEAVFNLMPGLEEFARSAIEKTESVLDVLANSMTLPPQVLKLLFDMDLVKMGEDLKSLAREDFGPKKKAAALERMEELNKRWRKISEMEMGGDFDLENLSLYEDPEASPLSSGEVAGLMNENIANMNTSLSTIGMELPLEASQKGPMFQEVLDVAQLGVDRQEVDEVIKNMVAETSMILDDENLDIEAAVWDLPEVQRDIIMGLFGDTNEMLEQLNEILQADKVEAPKSHILANTDKKNPFSVALKLAKLAEKFTNDALLEFEVGLENIKLTEVSDLPSVAQLLAARQTAVWTLAYQLSMISEGLVPTIFSVFHPKHMGDYVDVLRVQLSELKLNTLVPEGLVVEKNIEGALAYKADTLSSYVKHMQAMQDMISELEAAVEEIPGVDETLNAMVPVDETLNAMVPVDKTK